MLLSSIIIYILHKCVSIKTLINNEVSNIKKLFVQLRLSSHNADKREFQKSPSIIRLPKLPKEHSKKPSKLSHFFTWTCPVQSTTRLIYHAVAPFGFDRSSNQTPLLLYYAIDYLQISRPSRSFSTFSLLVKWTFSFHEILLPLGLPRACSVALGLSSCYGLSHYNSEHARSSSVRPLERWKSVKRRTPGQRV